HRKTLRTSPEEDRLIKAGYKRSDPPNFTGTRKYWIPGEYDPRKHQKVSPGKHKLDSEKTVRNKHLLPNPFCENCDCSKEYTKQVENNEPRGVPQCGCADSDCVEEDCPEPHYFPVKLQIRERKPATTNEKEPKEAEQDENKSD